MYLTSIESLALLPVWERQRTLRPQRSLLIAEEKIRLSSLRGNSTAGITGIISAYMHRTSGDVGILDGQHRCHQFMQPIILKHFLIINSIVSLHRVGALAILSDKGQKLCMSNAIFIFVYVCMRFSCMRINSCACVCGYVGWWDLKRKNIVMEVFLVDDEEQIVDLFRDINSAEPVRLVDMPYSHLEEEENTEDGDEDSNVISAEEGKDEQNESGVELAQPTVESSTAATEPNQEQLQQTSAESFLDVPTSGTTAQEEKPSFSEEKQEAISVSVIAEPTEMAELPSTATTPMTPAKKKIIKKKVAKSSPADTPTQPSSDGSDSIAETANTSEDSSAKKKKVKKPSAKVDQLRRDVLEEVALTLKNLHPAMVLSQKVRSPFLNLDVIRDDLFQCRSLYLLYGAVIVHPFKYLCPYIHCRFVREMKVSESGNLTAQHEQLVNRLYQRIMELNKQIGEEEVARLAAEG